MQRDLGTCCNHPDRPATVWRRRGNHCAECDAREHLETVESGAANALFKGDSSYPGWASKVESAKGRLRSLELE